MSIYWVKETVAANTVGTVDSFADPFGIQKVFDTAVAGDEISILKGVNNYDSNSASWADSPGRDDSTKVINVNTNSGSTTDHILVSGWTDETTEGEVTLDFEKGLIVGGNGFTVTQNRIDWKNIHVTNAEVDGWDISLQPHMFYRCRATVNGVHGWDVGGSAALQKMVRCVATSNGGDGVNGPVTTAFCEFFGNTALGGQGVGDNLVHAFTLFDDNTGDGASCDDNCMFVNCTFEHNDDGIAISSSNLDSIFVNCGFTNNTNYGIANATGFIPLEINCAYYGNGTGASQPSFGFQENRVTADPQYTDAGTRDYSIGTNWRALGEGGFLSGDSTGYVDIGAVQREEAGGGGGTVNLLQGKVA